jgi:hypothetical protein
LRNSNDLYFISYILPIYTSLQLEVEILSSFSLHFLSNHTENRDGTKQSRAKRTYSFGNHSTPALFKGPLHDGVVSPRWTRPDNERVRHAQPIDSHAKIGLSLSPRRRKHLEPNSPGPSPARSRASPGELGRRVLAPEMSQTKRRHGSKAIGEILR